MEKKAINPRSEFRLYGKLNCSFFDLISGELEPNQTKSLGLLLAKSSIAMETFLKIIYPENSKQCNELINCRCVVDCEAIQNVNNRESYRADLILRFYRNNYIPYRAIVIEAKSISIKVNAQKIQEQIEEYEKTFNIIKEFNQQDLVTITKYKCLNTGETNIISITWNDVIDAFSKIKNNTLIIDFCNYLFKINGAMKFYEEDVLSIPASNTIDEVEKFGIYECPNNSNYSGYDKRTLYLSFRAKKGISNKLYKVNDVIPVTLGDNRAIEALDNVCNGYADRLKQYIAARQDKGLNTSEEKLVFFLNLNESINLPYPSKPAGRNNTYKKCYSLSKYFGTPNADGYVII